MGVYACIRYDNLVCLLFFVQGVLLQLSFEQLSREYGISLLAVMNSRGITSALGFLRLVERPIGHEDLVWAAQHELRLVVLRATSYEVEEILIICITWETTIKLNH